MKTQNSLLALCGFSLYLSQVLHAYDLHEWGTFTTVSGSDGRLLTGLQVEEEHLPAFVYSHLGMKSVPADQFFYMDPKLSGKPILNEHQIAVLPNLGLKGGKVLEPMIAFKGMPVAQLQNVTVKMETPVIYFYGNDTRKINIKVGFNGGTISQWYPQRKSGDTPNKVIKSGIKLSDQLQKVIGNREMVSIGQPIDFGDLKNPYQGAVEWDVEIMSKSAVDPAITFKPDENPTWIYPRVPGANVVKVGSEYEDFLFYRGVGNFKLPATFSVDASETLNVTNNSNQAIPFAFAFENIAGQFRYKKIGKIPAGEVARVAESEWIKPSENEPQQVAVFRQMREGLTAQGLTTDEANGMIKTWWKSYFNKTGLRVFWIVPQTDLEKILPLKAAPAPANQVRVLVGRSDIMRPKFEQQMIADLGTHAFGNYSSDRFLQPYMNRLSQLVTKPVFQKFDAENLKNTPLQIAAKKGDSMSSEGFYLYPGSAVTLQHLKLTGAWEITNKNELKIGETIFKLNPENGILTAKATADPAYDTYEIQLPKALN